MLGEIDKHGVATTGWTPPPPPETANQLTDLCGTLALVARLRGTMAPLGTDNASADELLREIGVPCLQGPLDSLFSLAPPPRRSTGRWRMNDLLVWLVLILAFVLLFFVPLAFIGSSL